MYVQRSIHSRKKFKNIEGLTIPLDTNQVWWEQSDSKWKNLSIELDASNQRWFQKIFVKFLYYAQAIDSTMLMALNSLSSVQTNPTVETAKEITYFLNICAVA